MWIWVWRGWCEVVCWSQSSHMTSSILQSLLPTLINIDLATAHAHITCLCLSSLEFLLTPVLCPMLPPTHHNIITWSTRDSSHANDIPELISLELHHFYSDNNSRNENIKEYETFFTGMFIILKFKDWIDLIKCSDQLGITFKSALEHWIEHGTS